jgi:hypothetical protein
MDTNEREFRAVMKADEREFFTGGNGENGEGRGEQRPRTTDYRTTAQKPAEQPSRRGLTAEYAKYAEREGTFEPLIRANLH